MKLHCLGENLNLFIYISSSRKPVPPSWLHNELVKSKASSNPPDLDSFTVKVLLKYRTSNFMTENAERVTTEMKNQERSLFHRFRLLTAQTLYLITLPYYIVHFLICLMFYSLICNVDRDFDGFVEMLKLVEAALPFDELMLLPQRWDYASDYVSLMLQEFCSSVVRIGTTVAEAYTGRADKDTVAPYLDKCSQIRTRFGTLNINEATMYYFDNAYKTFKGLFVGRLALADDFLIFLLRDYSKNEVSPIFESKYSLLISGTADLINSRKQVTAEMLIPFYQFATRMWKNLTQNATLGSFTLPADDGETFFAIMTYLTRAVFFEPDNPGVQKMKRYHELYASLAGHCPHCAHGSKMQCKCESVSYCTEECQRAAWPNHKLFCGRETAEESFKRLASRLPWPEYTATTGDKVDPFFLVLSYAI